MKAFTPELQAAKNLNGVILSAYRALGLELPAHNRCDFACLLVARRNHKRRFTGPECLEVLVDCSFPKYFTIDDLLNDSMALQLVPAGL
jgi:hypothetical protein